MRGWVPALLVFAGSLSVPGCAAPGSGMVRISVEGVVLGPDGLPCPDKEIRLAVPAGYGLRGFDAMWGKPEDFGHSDHVAVVRTTEDGRFSGFECSTTYSMAFWLIPPLGFAFQGPPDPVLFLRFQDEGDETYRVKVSGEEVKVAVFDRGVKGPVDREPRYRITGSCRNDSPDGAQCLRVELRLERVPGP